MPNILLTRKCVRSCPYCFAKKQLSEKAGGETLKWEDLVYLADLFAEGGCREMRFLGGEPALHPAFADFVAYSLKRGFSVLVFSSGILSGRVTEDLRKIFDVIPQSGKNLSFLCNLNDPGLAPPAETRCVEKFLEEFGTRVQPGFNIYRKDFSLDFLFEYMERYKMKRAIRLGLTHPIHLENNSFIPVADMRVIADRLLDYLPLFDRYDAVPTLDCGFPMCLFSDEQLGRLYKISKGTHKFSCGTPVDIGPDMSAWSCFPLSAACRKSVYDFDGYGQMMEYFESFTKSIRKEAGGIYAECGDCAWRRKGVCAGGCAAHILRSRDAAGRVAAVKI